jgi:FkbM family methyltransferase
VLRNLKNRLKEILCFKCVGFNPYGRYGVPFALGKYLKHRSNIMLVDVGAHEGSFTRSIDNICSVSRGILIEPQPARASELRTDFPAPRFAVVEAAICDRSGQLELEINNFDATTSILKTKRSLPELSALDVMTRTKVTCRTMTLDTVFNELRVLETDLLKLDVQGAEHLVVRGATQALARTSMVWTEVSFVSLYDGACLFHELHAELYALGFRLAEIESGFRGPDGELLQADALFLKR